MKHGKRVCETNPKGTILMAKPTTAAPGTPMSNMTNSLFDGDAPRVARDDVTQPRMTAASAATVKKTMKGAYSSF